MLRNNIFPTISIIIPTYNRCNHVIKTLKSFQNQNYPKDKYEIILVDNNSTDDTNTIVRDYIQNQTSTIRYYLEPRTGNHYARNKAAAVANGEILYFCDDDVIADPLLLREIVTPFYMDETVGTATGRVLPKWETPPPKWIVEYCNNKFLSLLDPPEIFLISNSVNLFFSCHQAVRKDVFLKAGGFNPESFATHYLGDGETGLNIKIKNLGYRFAFVGSSITYHVIPPKRYTQTYLNNRLGNAGNAQAYTDFRRGSGHRAPHMITMILKALFIYLPLSLSAILYELIKTMDPNVLRFVEAQGYFALNYVRYSYRLLLESDWRRFASKSNWMQNDTDFEAIIRKHLN